MFSFSRKERNGIFGLILIIFLLILAGKLIPFLIPADRTNFKEWESEVNACLAEYENKDSTRKELVLVAFDPNKVDSVGLTNMGLPEKIVANWVHYLRKGGAFRTKTDVKKIFGMTSLLYEQLDTFMVIQTRSISFNRVERQRSIIQTVPGTRHDTIAFRAFPKKEKSGTFVLELNSTDSINLIRIPGIGPVLASRIIRYRNLLGGYYTVSQIKEVYGLKGEIYPVVSSYLTVEPSSVKTFNINFSTLNEIGHHPYIGYKTARKLLRLRDKMGKFLASEDLSSIVNSDSLKRLVPYLKFSQ